MKPIEWEYYANHMSHVHGSYLQPTWGRIWRQSQRDIRRMEPQTCRQYIGRTEGHCNLWFGLYRCPAGLQRGIPKQARRLK